MRQGHLKLLLESRLLSIEYETFGSKIELNREASYVKFTGVEARINIICLSPLDGSH